MEIDFLIAKGRVGSRHNIIPIEVKSGKNYTLSSIQKLRKKYAEQTENAVVIHTGDLKDAGEILYIPLYMTMLL
jgi:predicted AAA+ superfamily ATPase